MQAESAARCTPQACRRPRSHQRSARVRAPTAVCPPPRCRRALIGEMDEDLDGQIDFDSVRAPPLKPLHH